MYKGCGVKGLEVFDSFACADEMDGEGELLLDSDGGATLGGAVELGEDKAGQRGILMEGLGLVEGVLAEGGV